MDRSTSPEGSGTGLNQCYYPRNHSHAAHFLAFALPVPRKEAFTEKLEERGEKNVKVILSLLGEAFNGAEVAIGDSPLDGRKFKVVAENRNMFLCVSRNYLNDQHESRVRKDFDHYSLAQTLAANPGKYFFLCSEGLQSIAASDAAS